MIKKCSKCETEFNCRHNEILKCHCVQVSISDEGKKYIAENFSGCLCNVCLKEVAALFTEQTKNA